MGWLRSGRVYKLTKENLAKVPNSAGNYKLYNKEKKPVYVGTTAGKVGAKWGKNEDQRYRYGLRHRLGSYQQEDDYKVTAMTKRDVLLKRKTSRACTITMGETYGNNKVTVQKF